MDGASQLWLHSCLHDDAGDAAGWRGGIEHLGDNRGGGFPPAFNEGEAGEGDDHLDD